MITRPSAFATGVVSLATLLTYGGRWSWACELFVNFRTHLALLLGLLLILAAVTRHWRIAGVAARDLLKTSGFRDCAAGRGLLPTWPSDWPALLRIRIDQCLARPMVSIAGVSVGRSVGSDHLATINDFSVAHATP